MKDKISKKVNEFMENHPEGIDHLTNYILNKFQTCIDFQKSLASRYENLNKEKNTE